MQETDQSLEQFQSAPSTLFLGISRQVLNKQSRFLTVFLLVPLVFKPAKGIHLPGVGYQGWGAQHVVQTTFSQ